MTGPTSGYSARSKFDSGRSIGLGGLRQRTLLVLLLLRANEAVSRDRLIDDLWGAEPPATAANALAALVARLRRLPAGCCC